MAFNLEGFFSSTLVPRPVLPPELAECAGQLYDLGCILGKSILLISSSFSSGFIVGLLPSSLRLKLCVWSCRLFFARSWTITRDEKKAVDSALCTEQGCFQTSVWSSERWAPAPLSPVASLRPHTDFHYTRRLSSFCLLSHISHSCLFPSSTYRSDKTGILVKFKQVDSLLDQGPGGEISISVCVICWLLEVSWLVFLKIVFLSITSDGKMHYYGFALWVLRSQKTLHPKKEPTMDKYWFYPAYHLCDLSSHIDRIH